ncbi:MAG: oxidoreductase [Chitinophagales bacterium]|nr:MAG: oxidoreductase [Chitinophagales bacterium]
MSRFPPVSYSTANASLHAALEQLGKRLEGELFTDNMTRAMYATDASVYREWPLAVVYPKHAEDIKELIHFARREKTHIIPRTAGTSLAGQCVGGGIVADVSRHMHHILEIHAKERWVRVQPGVIRDELNLFLKPYGLFFGPNTSTANRAMIGGMVGNNSCGSYSIVYGTTRDHVLELKTILSDGSEVVFKALSDEEFRAKAALNTLEGQIYRHIADELGPVAMQEEIRRQFPHRAIHRRNTGYAVDALIETSPFSPGKPLFNFCKMLAGSEGTLAFITEIKLNCVDLPPAEQLLVCIHFNSLDEALQSVLLVHRFRPRAIELMDKNILECTKENIEQQRNRFFVHGDPEAILVIEFGAASVEVLEQTANQMIETLQTAGLGYHFPKVYPPDISRVWKLREAGLGLLSNVKGDRKPVAVIEDTAVRVEDLPDYIREFSALMQEFKQQPVYYAHAGAGELHLRPKLNLRDPEDVKQFRAIATASAQLVKKYNGSLSGEHGDGRVRGEFIPFMMGEKIYQLFRRIKYTWDPDNIFNPGKIVDTPPMDTALRYEPGQPVRPLRTLIDFSDAGNMLRAVEKCNGSADCRKLAFAGGTMCPSYMATRNEKDTTRARANVLREFLTHSQKSNPFDHQEIAEVMDLCLSCKGCKSECPSNVDMALLKAEFLYQYYQSHRIPLRSLAIAHIGTLNRLAILFPALSNYLLSRSVAGSWLKRLLHIAPQRSLPLLHRFTLRKWFSQNQKRLIPHRPLGKVYLYADEFTNYNDVETGIKAVCLLSSLGYEVCIPQVHDSGRAFISKGLLQQARKLAVYNVTKLAPIVSEHTPLIGIEPSALLSFRDEYPLLVDRHLKPTALQLKQHALLIDEFISREIKKGNISPQSFTDKPAHILLHGHCHQKALSSLGHTVSMLSLPENYSVTTIPSGCCGMAGSFGYEKEHYDLSLRIGELVLFPRLRKAHPQDLIAAPGTSCRHQIADGTGIKAFHPVEILAEALKPEIRNF